MKRIININKKLEYLIYIGLLLIIGVIFFFFAGERGYILEKDSGVFLDKNISYQYIVYPQFLELCHNIFGEEHYLQWISHIQGLISLCVSLITTEYFRKNYKLSYVWSGLIFICTFGPYAYSLPQYVSSHSILTEGLAFPLFYVWMLCTLEIYLNKKNIYFFPLLMVTVIMFYTRTQLLLFVIVYLLMLFERVFQFVFHRLTRRQKVFVAKGVGVCGIIALFLGVKVFFLFVENNVFPQLTDAVAGRVFCAAERTDADLFEGRNREIFIDIFEEIEKLETRQSYFGEGIRQWEDIADSTNENTNMLYRVILPHSEGLSGVGVNDIKGQLAYTLLVKHWDDYLYMSMVLLFQSLCVSIFVHPEAAYLLGFVISFALYLVAILFAILCKKKYRVKQQYLVPLLLTLFVILSMCGIVNILFIGIQRYVVYPFGFFYISLIILCNGLIREKREG